MLAAGPEDLDRDYGLDPFDIPGTVAAVREALGEIPCQVLASDVLASTPGAARPPTLDGLCTQLTGGSYTLLHLVCHGRHDRRNGDTILYLPEGADRRKPVSTSLLIERLDRLGQGLPHFVFLSTCESASPEAEAGFGGLAQRLVRGLAMTGPVSIHTAGKLSAAFYAGLR